MKRLFPRGPLQLFFVCCYMLFWHGSRVEAAQSLRVASFNIQVFGPSKINKPFIHDSLLTILNRYDLVFIQEIRDSGDSAIHILLESLRRETSRDFQLRLSERLGRGEMKEQYAYIFDADRVAALDSYTFHDEDDRFEREPFVGRFQAGDLEFTIAGIHVTPTDVKRELIALGDVHREIRNRYNDRNLFIVGDINADCLYYKPNLGFDYFDETPQVLVSDDEDTTVGATHCAYDRVFAFGTISRQTSAAHAFNFQDDLGIDLASAKLISDHYPIEFEIDLGDAGASGDSPYPSCGLESTISPKGYCMGVFGGSKQRVPNVCCAYGVSGID